MASLDDISFKLGELTAQQRAMRAEMHALVKPIVDEIEVMKPHVRHYAAMRKRTAWVNSLIVGVGSMFGGSIATWAMNKYG